MRRFLPYFIIFIGIVSFLKALSLFDDSDSKKDNKSEEDKTQNVQMNDNNNQAYLNTNKKSKINITDQNGQDILTFYNTDTSNIQKIATCEQLNLLHFSQEEVELLQALRQRHIKLQELEQDLQVKQDMLKSIQEKISHKMIELEKISSEMMTDDNITSTQNYSKLVKIYEGMKPKDAAKVFDTLQTSLLLKVAQQMKENKLAAIVAEMNPEKARDLTIGLAK